MPRDFPKSKLSHLLWFFGDCHFIYHIYRSGKVFLLAFLGSVREREGGAAAPAKNLSSQKISTVIGIERGRGSEWRRVGRGRWGDPTRPDKTI